MFVVTRKEYARMHPECKLWLRKFEIEVEELAQTGEYLKLAHSFVQLGVEDPEEAFALKGDCDCKTCTVCWFVERKNQRLYNHAIHAILMEHKGRNGYKVVHNLRKTFKRDAEAKFRPWEVDKERERLRNLGPKAGDTNPNYLEEEVEKYCQKWGRIAKRNYSKQLVRHFLTSEPTKSWVDYNRPKRQPIPRLMVGGH